MNRIKLLGVALMAVFVFSVLAATVSSAAEGPFYKVNGTRLAAGATRLLLVTAKEKFTLESKGVGITITCNGLTLPTASQMQILGLATGNGSDSKEILEFTACSVTGNGTGCEVTGGKITTKPVINLLGYATSTRTGSVLVLFAPEVGKNFVTISFTGAECIFKETTVEGNTVGLARVNGAPVIVGSEPAETLHGEVTFPHGSLIFLEKGGVLTHVKGGLSAFGVGSTLNGAALILVDENGAPVKWGVFTA